MYKRLYGTRKGRNVVLNPVPSHHHSIPQRICPVYYNGPEVGVFRSYMCTYKYFDVCCSTGGAPNWRGDSILKIAVFHYHSSVDFDVV